VEKTPEGPVLKVAGADLVSCTPIYDIKPYLPYADCKPEAVGGFTDRTEKRTVEVRFSDPASAALSPEEKAALASVLRQDPRPAYQDNPDREYAFSFGGKNVRFSVRDGILTVSAIE
jgi:hypothetical protein